MTPPSAAPSPMPHEYRFQLALVSGLHARPASLLADVAARFSSGITIGKIGAPGVDARSVLSVVGLDAKLGDDCILCADGPDAPDAIAALKTLFDSGLAHAEDAAELPPQPDAASVQLPFTLRRMQAAHVNGRPMCAGIAHGKAVVVAGLTLPDHFLTAAPGSVETELQAARNAIAAIRADLLRKASGKRGIERELIEAHAKIAGDSALWAEIERAIRAGSTAVQGVAQAAERFSRQLSAATSAYIRERALDVQDVSMQLLDHLTGGALQTLRIELRQPSIVIASVLTPNQLLGMDRRHLMGLVLGSIGPTSHTVILARSLGIPTILDASDLTLATLGGAEVILDAGGGFLLTSLTPEIRNYYQLEIAAHLKRSERFASVINRPAVTMDGATLEIGANASSEPEVALAMQRGADGVGLVRTELMFLDRPSPPSEAELFDACSAIARAAGSRPVIIRTFDIGGDKPADYLRIPREDNPFLGVRGLRLYPRHQALLHSQLRAILRAGVGASLKIMAPMVATASEAAWFRDQVRAAEAELRSQGVPFAESMPVGVMIETPAAAMIIDQLSASVDFFSVGTNDLCQYCMAADRGNTGVAALCSPRQPAFLRMLRMVVDSARRARKWVGICGEMAGDPFNLPLMVGLGVNEISVASGEVLALKLRAGRLDAAACRDLLSKAVDCTSPQEVDAMLASAPAAPTGTFKLLDPSMIDVAAPCSSKEQAIKAAVDLLFIAGRTDQPRAVEEAVWAREATYSTGLGYGFAIPHCKTDAVLAPALAVLKLPAAIEWGSMDGQPVNIVILLAVPASEAAGGGAAGHMKTFARLARKLMHEEFRERMIAAADAPAVETCLREELGIE